MRVFEADYTQNIINLIKFKKILSTAEFNETGLIYKQSRDIYSWRDGIIMLINRSPPKNIFKELLLKKTKDE